MSASELGFHIISTDVDLGVCYPPQLIIPRSFYSNPVVVYLSNKDPCPRQPKGKQLILMLYFYKIKLCLLYYTNTLTNFP